MTYTTQASLDTANWRRQRRERLLREYDHCHYCGVKLCIWWKWSAPPAHHVRTKEGCRFGYATLEHIVPLSCGGQDTEVNTVLACSVCNAEKSMTPYEDFLALKARDRKQVRE